MSLAEVFASIATPDTGLRTGVVKKITGDRVIVNVAGAEVDVAVCEPYSPALGETVSLLKSDSTYLALGRPMGAQSGVPASGTIIKGSKVYTTAGTKISGFGSEVAIPDYEITIRLPEQQLVHLCATMEVTSTVSGDNVLFLLHEDSFTGTIVGMETVTVHDSSLGYASFIEGWVKGDGQDHRYIMTGASYGAGTIGVASGAVKNVFLARKIGLYDALIEV